MIAVNDNLAFLLVPKNASTSIRAFYHITEADINQAKLTPKYINKEISYFTFNNTKLLCTNRYSRIRSSVHVDLNSIMGTGIIHFKCRVIAIIRNPLERQLSLYFYRHRQKKYNTKISIEDFRSSIADGVLEGLYMWQEQSQYSFTEHSEKKVEYWKYEDINQKFLEFGQLQKHNTSFSIDKLSTADLVNTFYDQKSKDAVKRYWKKDFELYESIC
jgi:hypothetical protein